jgi:hypothetical protein
MSNFASFFFWDHFKFFKEFKVGSSTLVRENDLLKLPYFNVNHQLALGPETI